MDNLFQILAVIFIVYSILAPLFNAGKDKKNRTQTGRGNPGPLSSGPIITGDKRSDTAAGQNERYTAGRTSAGRRTADTRNTASGREYGKFQGEYYRSRSETTTLPSGTFDDKQSYDAAKQYVEGKVDYDNIASYDQLPASKTVRKAARPSSDILTEQKAQQQLPEQNIHITDVRKMLRNPATLQEIILLSEIVSKPRAYHRKPGL